MTTYRTSNGVPFTVTGPGDPWTIQPRELTVPAATMGTLAVWAASEREDPYTWSLPDVTIVDIGNVFTPISGGIYDICVSIMPNGKAFVTYKHSGSVWGMVLDSVTDLVGNDIYNYADGTILFTPSPLLKNSSNFTIGPNVYLHVAYEQPSTVHNIKVFKAVDANNPLAGFVEHGTLSSYDFSNGTLWLNGQCGIPMILPNGRWVMTAPEVNNNLGYATERFGVFTSDDQGASWTLRSSLGYYFAGSYMANMAGNVGWLSDGRIYTSSSGGIIGGTEGDLHVSSDFGTTWSSTYGHNGGVFPVGSNGDDSYMMHSGTGVRILDPATLTAGPIIANIGLNIGNAFGNHSMGFKALWLAQTGKMLYMNHREIAMGLGGWWVGQVGIG